jgi:3-hydroxyacyl-[acyl-carrier-protein] dehydratase
MQPARDAAQAVNDIVVTDGGASGRAVFAPSLPVFAGHFPGRPLVPGVYLLAALAEVARRCGVAGGEIRAIERAKWSAPAFPGQELRLCVRVQTVPDGGVRLDGEVSGPDGHCAAARLLLR